MLLLLSKSMTFRLTEHGSCRRIFSSHAGMDAASQTQAEGQNAGKDEDVCWTKSGGNCPQLHILKTASAVNAALQFLTQERRCTETREAQEVQSTSGNQIWEKDENFNILCKTSNLVTSASNGNAKQSE